MLWAGKELAIDFRVRQKFPPGTLVCSTNKILITVVMIKDARTSFFCPQNFLIIGYVIPCGIKLKEM